MLKRLCRFYTTFSRQGLPLTVTANEVTAAGIWKLGEFFKERSMTANKSLLIGTLAMLASPLALAYARVSDFNCIRLAPSASCPPMVQALRLNVFTRTNRS
jgi:hypothetical protein